MSNVAPVVDMNGNATGTVATVNVIKGGPVVIDASVRDMDSPNFDGGSLDLHVTRSVDGDGGENGQAGAIFKVAPANRAPVVTSDSSGAIFTETFNNAPPRPVFLDQRIRVEDADGSVMSTTLTFTSGYRATEDRLELADPGGYGVTAAWNAGKGTLTLSAASASMTPEAMRTALSLVTYVNIADEPTGGDRSIGVTVSDGPASSAAATLSVRVMNTMDATVIDLNGGASGVHVALGYTEQAPAVLVAPAATLIDADTPDFAGARLSITNSFGSAEDRTAVRHVGDGSGQIGVGGSTLLYGGAAIGTISGGLGSTTSLTVSFTAGATNAAVQALLRSIEFSSGSDAPGASRRLDFTMFERDATLVNSATASIQITAVDDPLTYDLDPAAPGNGAVATYSAGSAVTAIAPGALLSDPDTGDYSGGSLDFRLVGGQPGDVVGIIDQGVEAGQIGVEDDIITYGGIWFATAYPLQGRVAFHGRTVPEEAVQALIRAIGFSNVNADPGSQARSVEVRLISSPNAAALVETVSITVKGAPPALTLLGDEGANELRGGAGDDQLRGLGGNDRLFGDAGKDLMDGGAGADRMTGGAGDDVYHVDDARDVVVEAKDGGRDAVMSGVTWRLGSHVEELALTGSAAIDGTGNGLSNRIAGNGAANTLQGSGGSDVLIGGGGADRLFGGDGADRLEGGAGRDLLTGGAGGDVFVFGPDDLATARAGADRVVDFSAGDGDRIDLSAIDAVEGSPGDQAFGWIGGGAFTGKAGELRVAPFRGDAYLQGDTDGDALPDFFIRLDGTHAPVAADLVL